MEPTGRQLPDSMFQHLGGNAIPGLSRSARLDLRILLRSICSNPSRNWDLLRNMIIWWQSPVEEDGRRHFRPTRQSIISRVSFTSTCFTFDAVRASMHYQPKQFQQCQQIRQYVCVVPWQRAVPQCCRSTVDSCTGSCGDHWPGVFNALSK